jgi:hypothetical protein
MREARRQVPLHHAWRVYALNAKGAKVLQKVAGVAKETPSTLDALKKASDDSQPPTQGTPKSVSASVTFRASDRTALSISYIVTPPRKSSADTKAASKTPAPAANKAAPNK